MTFLENVSFRMTICHFVIRSSPTQSPHWHTYNFNAWMCNLHLFIWILIWQHYRWHVFTCVWGWYSSCRSLRSHRGCRGGKSACSLLSAGLRCGEGCQTLAQSRTPRQSLPKTLHRSACWMDEGEGRGDWAIIPVGIGVSGRERLC